MKKVFIIILSVLVFIASDARSKEVVDRIVAVVNDDIITLTDLRSQLKLYVNQIKARRLPRDREEALLYKVRTELLDNLINEKLTDQAAKKANIKVSKAEVDNAIERMKEANNLTHEALLVALKKEGLTLEEYKKQIQDQILRPRVINSMVRSKIVITNEEIEKYYKKNKDKYQGSKKYDLKHILLKKSPENIKLMGDLLNRLRKGESFDEINKKYSQSPLVKMGGTLGSINVEDLPSDLKKAIYATKKGEYSEVVDTRQGLQIFYVSDIKVLEGTSLSSVSAEIQKKLYNMKVEKHYKIWIEGLKKEAHIKIIK